QDFTMRYPLVFGQGNFGSVDGDGAAAMRYTEARLAAVGEELLVDLEKDTVDFSPNFDGSLNEPTVLPAKLPNLLLNGVGGIAVGMATNIPPHNLGELADAIAYLVDHYNKAEEVSLDELMHFIPGPDFPTGGTILGREGIRQAYATGKGRVIMRANAHVEELRGHSAIIVTELPYQVNKANLVERIADLARNARIEGIADLRDESDRTGMRVVVELKRGVEPAPVLAGLLKLTQMQCTFGVNALALVEGVPRVLPLKRILLHYIEHRHEVLFRRTKFELARAEARAHVLEGLLIALDNLDEVINTIRRSKTAETAQTNLCQRFKLTEIQARAILDMQLRRLAALERQKIEEEYKEVTRQVKYLKGLLANKAKILALVKEDVLDLKTRYGDARRTRIVDAEENSEFRAVDLAPDEQVCVTLSAEGIVRRQAASARNLEALGISAAPGDGPLTLFAANTREQALWFSDRGRAFLTPVHQVPDVVQVPQGVGIGRLVHLDEGEKVVAVCHLAEFDEGRFVSMITRQGKVKRLAVSELASCGIAGAVAIGLTEDDRLLAAMLTVGGEELLVVTEQAKAIRFQEDTVRPQGAAASGMRGITLKEGDAVVAAEVVVAEAQLLVATASGYAKRAAASEFPVQGRGGNGVAVADPAKAKLTGPIVDARFVAPSDSVALVSSTGSVHLVSVADVPKLERASWGRLVTASRRYAVAQLKDDTLVRCVPLGSAPAGAAAPAAPSPTTRGARATRRPSTVPKAGPAAQAELDLAKPARRPLLRRGKAHAAPAEPPPAEPPPAEPPPDAPKPSGRKRATPAKDSAASAAPERTPASPAAAPKTTRKTATEAQAAPKPARKPASQPPPASKPARAPVEPSAAPAKPARKAGDKATGATKPTASEEQPAEQSAPSKSSRTRRTTVSKPPERGRSRKGSS
ncbi:MAG: hypothetical protein GX557_11240, partial [Chloroflexi bacterium]|nr:hypothetical protein [Chloroflexota bacterium]